jgi:hypothetical protein
MGTRKSLRIVVLIAALAAVSVAVLAQTQNQNPPSANQTQSQPPQTQPPQAQQPQNSPQNQGQPQQKQSFWQKMKQSTLQNMQTSTQQGTQQVQQGTANGVQQGTQAVQQGAQAALAGGNSGNAALGGSNSSGSCGSTCFNAGPFLANVSQMTMSQQGGWHVISMNVQFQNTTNQPLIIAYHDGSMIMTDNNGATYQGAGGNPGELQGMGIDRGAQTDPQFVLNPGQTSSAMFYVARGRPANSPIGTGYSYNLTIDELQTQNGATAIVLRSYNLNFPTLTPGTGGSLTSFQSNSAGSAFTGGNTTNSSRVRGGTVPVTPTSGTTTVSPNTAATNAAMKSPVGATAKPSAAVAKPIPATTPINANKATTTTNKQSPTTNKNQPSTTTPTH